MIDPKVIESVVTSKVLNNTYLPYWAKVDQGSGIIFRGTYHELKSKELVCTLYNQRTFGRDTLGTKIIPLREVIDVNFAKCDMIIHRPKTDKVDDDDDDLDKLP